VLAPFQDVARLPLLDVLARGPETWDRLVDRAPTPSPFMRWAWHRAWAETAPAEDARAAFVMPLHGPGGDVQALLPFGVHTRRFRRVPVRALGWSIGNAGCPDHLDIPALPDVSLDGAAAALEELPWDVIVLDHVADDAPGVARLSDAFRRRGCAVRRTPTEWCPYLDLPADWDGYLASLSSTRRQAVRRHERTLHREHAVSLVDYGPDRLDEGWDVLRDLHARRWGHAGAFADPRVDGLLRRFSAALAASGDLWLTTLDVDGAPVAAWLGFLCGGTVHFYQSGRDPEWNSHGVGAVLMGMMIHRAIDRGHRRLDFLRGQESYKLSWTSAQRPNHQVVVFRRGWRGALLRTLDLAAHARAALRPEAERATEE
jgi:CelD/BcsL family acetyltransferase involved in cellulose biosynthesis